MRQRSVGELYDEGYCWVAFWKLQPGLDFGVRRPPATPENTEGRKEGRIRLNIAVERGLTAEMDCCTYEQVVWVFGRL